MKNDKCDLCALKVIFNQDSLSKERHIENFIDTLRQLQKSGIIEKGYERRIFAGNGSGDKSEMCAVNSKFFLPDNKDKKCPEFILNMGLSIHDAFSLNLSKKNIALTTTIKILTWFLVVLTIALLFIGVFQFLQSIPRPNIFSLRQHPIIIEQNQNKATEHAQQYGKNK